MPGGQNELCWLATSRLNEEQVIVHGDHLLRMKEEMVNKFKCSKGPAPLKTGAALNIPEPA